MKQRLDRGESFAAIGREVGRDASTVAYWARKHGLTPTAHARHQTRGAIPRSRLEQLLDEGLCVREIAVRVDRSQRTVRYWIERYALQQPLEIRRGRVAAALESGQRSIVRTCSVHGETTFVIERSGRTRCGKCRQARVAEWRRRTKERLVIEAGGSCAVCGYDKYPGALEFHHVDPSQKEFGLSARGVARSLEKLRAEAAKCVLLCGNCHAEVEAGIKALSLE